MCWSVYMCDGKCGLRFLERDMYGVDFDCTYNDNDTNTVSSFSVLVKILMDFLVSSFNEEVLSYDSLCLNDPSVEMFDMGWKHLIPQTNPMLFWNHASWARTFACGGLSTCLMSIYVSTRTLLMILVWVSRLPSSSLNY